MNTKELQKNETVTEPFSESASQPETPEEKPTAREKNDALKILLFGGAMLLFALVGLMFFFRPEVSETEKRKLAEFPPLTWRTLASGEWFEGISDWYADTYPGREVLVSAANGLKDLYGIRTVRIIRNDPADDPEHPGVTEDPENKVPIEKLGSVYVKGDTAFELYRENRENSERYAAFISRITDELSGKAAVYDMIVPISGSVNLSEAEQKSIGSSDASAAIAAMYAKTGDAVPVKILPTLLAHKNEYLYYRTDHHWTARGAYYAYTCFCTAAGLTPYSLDNWMKYEFSGFYGTLYNEAGQPKSLSSDTVEAWVPNGTNVIRITDISGETLKYTGGVVRVDTDKFYQNAASKYNCFIMGDHPLSEIHNETLSDGSAIAVVKESFGNALVPFLVDHYEYVYVIDYRSFRKTVGKSLSGFVSEKGIGTVLFINNLTATSVSARLSELETLLQ